MTKSSIHVLLVSAQAAPNLLPTLDPKLKPNEVVLLVSKKMQPRAEALASVLQQAQVKVSRCNVDDEHSFAELEALLLELAAAREGQSIALNVTGGTKLMALAAQSVALAAGWRIFYVDVDTDEIIWLGKEQSRIPLTPTLRLPHYLQGYGFRLENGVNRPAPQRRHHELLHSLIMQMGTLGKGLGQLNFMAQEAEDKQRLEAQLAPGQTPSPHLEALLRLFEEAAVLTRKNGVIAFADEDERSFAKGGWLESHVYRVIDGLHSELKLRDKAANLVVIDGSGVKNELDIAFMAKTRLFVIECKTARLDRRGEAKANDALFKIAEVSRRVGGLGTRGMLVSYRPLRDAERRLAKALGIEPVCGEELKRLSEHIKRWVNG